MTTTAQKQDWTGASGQKYTYFVHTLDTSFKQVPGNYIFTKRTATGWIPIYVGETSDLSQRFDNHHAMPCIKRNGATHIHAHESSPNATIRRAEESDLIKHLIKQWKPSCNG